jgi:hypothetical protein
MILYTCIYCEGKKASTDPSLGGHHPSEWITRREATCSSSGERFRYCLDAGCSYTESEIIPILAHVPGNWIVDKEPTCTEKGRMHTECTSGCGGTLDISDIPLADHVYGEYLPNGDATYTDDGTMSAVCNVCGTTSTIPDTGSALGLVRRFCDEVGAIDTGAGADVLYTALYKASYTYSLLSDEEKASVSTEADVLRAAIEEYNAIAEGANNDLTEATELALSPLSGIGFAALAALIALIKRRFTV